MTGAANLWPRNMRTIESTLPFYTLNALQNTLHSCWGFGTKRLHFYRRLMVWYWYICKDISVLQADDILSLHCLQPFGVAQMSGQSHSVGEFDILALKTLSGDIWTNTLLTRKNLSVCSLLYCVFSCCEISKKKNTGAAMCRYTFYITLHSRINQNWAQW